MCMLRLYGHNSLVYRVIKNECQVLFIYILCLRGKNAIKRFEKY